MSSAAPETGTTSPVVRWIDRLASRVGGPSLSRRGLLYRAAVVASALVVNPLQYVLRPMSAYASVCGPDNRCADGWSVFCCTINDGANTCPDGSYVAGWWKVDDSAFCLGSSRYYVDCNRRPGTSCTCRCNDSGCDRRRICCNNFRYGQCNTHISGVTEVMCRIVTCTPPWRWDPACSSTVRVDDATRDHSAGCLPGKDPTHIAIRYQDMGMTGSVLGAPVSPERTGPRGGRNRHYRHGWIFYLPGLGAHEIHGPLAQAYGRAGLASGPLGYPTTDTRDTADGTGRFARFEHGSLYFHPHTGGFAVVGDHDRRYRRTGGPGGRLGFPIDSTASRDAGATVVTRFQGGLLVRLAGGPLVELSDPLRQRWKHERDRLGWPVAPATTTPHGGPMQRFEQGVILAEPGNGLRVLWGAIARRYLTLGGPRGWGYPTANQTAVSDGATAAFVSVRAYSSPKTGPHWLDGPILDRYRTEGGPTGHLGWPTSDRVTTRWDRQRASFEHGAIVTGPSGGTHVLTTRESRSSAGVPSTSEGQSRATREASELPEP